MQYTELESLDLEEGDWNQTQTFTEENAVCVRCKTESILTHSKLRTYITLRDNSDVPMTFSLT